MINRDKIEAFIESFYKDFSRVRFNKWNYEDGCILIAAIALYQATGKEQFKSFVVNYMDRYVLEDGTIQYYKSEDYNLDNIAPGRALIFAYEQTQDEKYLKAITYLKNQLINQPRTKEGNFWHKKIYPQQVWLDGLFMAQPFYMEIESKFGKKEGYKDITQQFKEVRLHMFNKEKGLYYHGYDSSKTIFWADPESGCSQNFWLRSNGWYLMSIVDTMEAMSKAIFEYYMELGSIYKEGIKGILNYQDPDSKLFYQVIDHPEVDGNYLETSGSAMIAASIFKASRMKVILSEKYWDIGEGILGSLIDEKLIETKEGLSLKDNCQVAGLGPTVNRRDGSISYYLSEPIICDDNKGIAALFMAYAQYLLGLQK